ncbi:hypothetical protein E1287_38675 [Actinomadura sp. KC06]|uniref:hypothetical protein n=1 Tax=Actinomadura sp. KC06 TaxID=2530369 RepID=UPI00104BCBFB|nr:hypothetical protein [Actinomadura sp. KC06]TDD23763.1 hypothetical protein E1287_38675 [Actinomadura sp. KC06]
MHDTSSGAGTAATTDRAVEGGTVVALLRAVAVLSLLGTLSQGLTAGMFLNGDVNSIDPHQVSAFVVEFLVIVQLVLAILVWRRNRRLKWPLPGAIAILVFTFVQAALGVEGSVAAHVTLGVTLSAMEMAMVLRSFQLRVAGPAATA